MPSALTAFSNSWATASGNRSLRASTATRLMSLFLAATSLAIGTETVSLPVSVEKMYLNSWSKISCERCRRRQHRNLILLRNRTRRLGGARSERREQELHLVLGDHALGGLHGARRVRRVVGVDDLDLIGLAAGLDALGVRGFRPEIVAALLLQAFWRKRAGEWQRRADLYDVLSKAGSAGAQGSDAHGHGGCGRSCVTASS